METSAGGPRRFRRGLIAGVAGFTLVALVGSALLLSGGGKESTSDADEPLASGTTAGGDDGTSVVEEADGVSGGLAADATPAAEGELDLARPTGVAAQNLTAIGEGDRMIIPKAGVDAPLFYMKVPLDGQMPTPESVDVIAYYDFSDFPGMGGAPGLGGNAVYAGHVDSGSRPCKNGTVPPPCEAVLWDLNKLKVGDEIEVRSGGQSYKYRITSNQPVPADSGPWEQIVSATAEESLTIITCAGNFNRETRSYTDRQVVTAVRS